MDAIKLALNFKLKYVVGILCCILLVTVMIENRHFKLTPTYHIFKQNVNNDIRYDHMTVLNSTSSTNQEFVLVLASSEGDVALYQMLAGLKPSISTVLPEISPYKTLKLQSRILIIKLVQLYETQILLVLHDKAILRAYNLPDFSVKWETSLFEDSQTVKPVLHAGEIIASDVCLKPNYCGFVFIGMSFLSPDNHDHLEPTMNEDVSDHFSSLALNWHNGSIIWHHRPGDFISNRKSEESGIPYSHLSKHWKLNLFHTHKQNLHVGEKPWQSYRKEFGQVLPHSWTATDDTRLSLLTTNPSLINNLGKNANILAASYHNGIDLLDLASGRPRARIRLPQAPGRTFAYLSHESSEHLYDIQLSSTLDTQHYPRVLCMGSFTQLDNYDENRVVPEIDSLCHPVNYFDYPRFSQESWTEDMNKSVSPLVINNLGKPFGLWGIIFHLLGGNLKSANLRDIIFLTSEGALTSYSSAGHVNWRANSQVSWLHLSHFIKENQLLHESVHDTYTQHFRPTLQTAVFEFASPSVYMKSNILSALVMGWDSFSLVDLTDGHLLATHSLPCHPTHRPFVYGRKILVNCDSMIIGFDVDEAEQWIYLLALAISFTLAFVFLSWVCDPENAIISSL